MRSGFAARCRLTRSPTLCSTAVIVTTPWSQLDGKQLLSAMERRDTIEEELDGQLRAGFTLTGIYGDTNGSGHLHELNVPTFYASRCVK